MHAFFLIFSILGHVIAIIVFRTHKETGDQPTTQTNKEKMTGDKFIFWTIHGCPATWLHHLLFIGMAVIDRVTCSPAQGDLETEEITINTRDQTREDTLHQEISWSLLTCD